MDEFKESPPDSDGGGKWQRVYIDNEPTTDHTNSGFSADGHAREGIAHGIVLIMSKRKYS